MIKKQHVIFGIIGICAILVLFLSNYLFETVEKGTYHVIQRPISGTMEAKMT